MENVNCSLTAKDNQVGYYGVDNVWYPWHWNDYCTIYPTYYPSITFTEDKMSKAFKVVSKLVEMKIINNITIIKFIEIVNEITKVL